MSRHLFVAMVALMGFSSEALPDNEVDFGVRVVTGVGETYEDAKLDAFQQAISQVSGQLVQGITQVENNQLVVDKVLTFVDGDVKASKTISTATKNGLVHAEIRVEVDVTELRSRLSKSHLKTTNELDGWVIDANNRIRQISDLNAAEMLTFKLTELGPHNFVQAKMVQQPKVVELPGEMQVKLPFHLTLEVDAKAWKNFNLELTRLLKKTSRETTGQFSDKSGLNRDFYGREIKDEFYFSSFTSRMFTHAAYYGKRVNWMINQQKQHEERWGFWIFVCDRWVEYERPSQQLDVKWTGFFVSEDVYEVFTELLQKEYMVEVAVFDELGEVITTAEIPLCRKINRDKGNTARYVSGIAYQADKYQYSECWVGPFLFMSGRNTGSGTLGSRKDGVGILRIKSERVTVPLFMDSEDVKKIKRYSAIIREADGGPF